MKKSSKPCKKLHEEIQDSIKHHWTKMIKYNLSVSTDIAKFQEYYENQILE